MGTVGGGREAANDTSFAGTGSSTSSRDTPPAWAQRMKRGGHTGHAVQTAAHAARSGDSHGAGSSVNLSESDRS
jgi:type IV secretion system protein TrbL